MPPDFAGGRNIFHDGAVTVAAAFAADTLRIFGRKGVRLSAKLGRAA